MGRFDGTQIAFDGKRYPIGEVPSVEDMADVGPSVLDPETRRLVDVGDSELAEDYPGESEEE